MDQPGHRSHPGLLPSLHQPQPCGLYDPVEHVLDASSGIDYANVAIMADSATVDVTKPARLDFLGHLRRDPRDAQVSDEIMRLLAPVAAQSLLTGARPRPPSATAPPFPHDHRLE